MSKLLCLEKYGEGVELISNTIYIQGLLFFFERYARVSWDLFELFANTFYQWLE